MTYRYNCIFPPPILTYICKCILTIWIHFKWLECGLVLSVAIWTWSYFLRNKEKILSRCKYEKIKSTIIFMYLLCFSGLLVHLELFSKFTSPKSLYREAELRQLYEQVGYIFMNKNCITSSVQVVYECFNKYCPGFLVQDSARRQKVVYVSQFG